MTAERCKHCNGTGVIEITPHDEHIRRILAETAEDFQITEAELCSTSRRRYLVEARRYAATEMRKAGLQFKEIGFALGRRDHSTIVNLLNGKARG